MESLVLQAIKNRPTNTILQKEDIKIPTTFPKIDITLPQTFDGREIWKGLLTKSINQGKCGSCWAFAASNCLADKFNIQSMGQIHVDLSPVRMLICNFIADPKYTDLLGKVNNEILNEANVKELATNSCFGNTLVRAWNFLTIWGTTTQKCAPYDDISNFINVSRLPLCLAMFGLNGDMCNDYAFRENIGIELGTPARYFRSKHFYLLPTTQQIKNNQDYIKYSLYKYGPVTASFEVYEDFYTFDPKKEIYKWNDKGKMISGHAISIVGWGEKNGVPYWIIKNFWGEKWGMNGYFYMLRGSNECKIEDNVIDGAPDFFYPPNYDPNYLHSAEVSEGSITTIRRFLADNEINLLNGGIDPSTGYSRRILRNKPWLDKSRLIDLENLPNFNTWFAGRDATFEKCRAFQKRLHKKDVIFYKGYFLISMLLVLLVIILLCKK